MTHPVARALTKLVERAQALQPDKKFVAEFDPEWRSDCELNQDDNLSYWRPCPQTTTVDFNGLANAIEQPVHPAIIAYYTTYWAGSVETSSEEGHVSLIQLWNPDDFERLIGNLLGHYMAKQQTRAPFSVFFATTEPDSELFLSIENESGRVLLEQPGKKPLRVVENDLASFLNRLTPAVGQPGIY